MLNIQESREYLGPEISKKLSDQEVKKVRDEIYALAGIFCDYLLLDTREVNVQDKE